MKDSLKFEEERIEKFQKTITDDKNSIYLVGMIRPPRPGVRSFFQKLEYSYFPPGTDKNDDFTFAFVEWEGTIWSVAGIPRDYFEIAKEIAKEFKVRIAGGIPNMVSEGKVIFFPIDGDNVFTLENTPDHEVYVSGPDGYKKIIEKEREELMAGLEKRTEKKEKQKAVEIIWDEE